MGSRKKAVIIGAGTGGITTAAFLAKAGFDVEVYEKNPNPGGRCGQMMQNGYRFDLGATILLMPSIYREVFSALGMDMDKELETSSLEPVYKIFFEDGTVFPYTRLEEEMKAQLEAIEPGCYNRYQKYISEGYDFYNRSMKLLLNRNYRNIFDFINLKTLLLLLRMKIWIRHMNYIRKFFKDPRLQKVFTFQNIYVGQNPYRQPAFFSMLPSAEVIEGALFPKGGMYRIVSRLMQAATDWGAKFYFNKEVESIITEGREVKGIKLRNGGVVYADIVIANADLPYVYKNLLPSRAAAGRLARKSYSCSAMVFHWGVDKSYPQLSHHSIFLNEPYKKGMDLIFKKKSLSDNPSFYIHAPSGTDPAAAPEGHETISVIIPSPNVDKRFSQNWEELKQSARSSVIRRLKEAGLTDIEEHIRFELSFLPTTFESYCNVSHGSVFGSLSHSLFQMGYFRPHNRHGKYKNLYFSGGSTHPGNGIPLVLLSAKLTSERIIKEQYH
ncbi:MAG: phytoene desaturase family protein [Bacteroidales bacterium]|nr:phytoene desaturase family protein [Bacteroidales bacterium]MDD2426170.1 phytoene desaturase family protein [Bacteroidales bacterium]MDD3989512.1 phytoene desaturase family protein [Bacteroidales bacterium]MDD4639111.1 phytoene desaturase family protein [Bacteroidales bacterium]